jgi:hypothetical protein
MKTLSLFLLPVALFFAFIGCSDSGGGGSGSGGGSTPDVNVNVSVCGDVDGILKCAVERLKEEKWDEAVAYYNAAYEKDNNNLKAIIYSVLANLAKISTDPDVVTLIKDNFGFTNYPNRLNALLSDEWMTEYKEERHDDCYPYDYYSGYVGCPTKYKNVMLPSIETPSWVKGNGSAYNNALLSGNVLTVDNFAISLLANVLDKNLNGVNTLLDNVIDGVFGASYNVAAERLKKLENRKEDRIKLDPYFIKQLKLENIFDEYDQIGWAEVNAILSATLLVKASLEWVQSYDLNTDLNWLKYSWKDDADDVLNHFKKVDAKKLPFNNNFFKTRTGKMTKSKEDYLKAIQGLQSSYASIMSSELYPTKVKDSYATISGGFNKLIDAIKNGSKFYVPKDPTKGNWPASKSGDVVATIDLGKFFTESYFSLQNIFETSDGKPVFYLVKRFSDEGGGASNCFWNEYCPPAPAPEPEPEAIKLGINNYADLISKGGRMLALAINTAKFKAVIDLDEIEIEYLPIGLSGDAAKAVFEKYYK